MEKTLKKEKAPRVGMTLKKENLIFYICIVVLPLIQISIFWLYLKIQSIVLSFQNYTANSEGMGYIISFAGFDNFVEAFNIIGSSLGATLITNSLIMYAVDLVVGMGLALIFSYYIAKKYAFSGVFKVFLFMPQIISGVVFGIIFKYLVSDVYTILAGTAEYSDRGLLYGETQFATVLFYNVWLGFGSRVLITSSAMSGIDESIIESASLDGCTPMKEFFHITMPLIFPTFETLILLGLAGLFTNQRSLHTLLGNRFDAQTGNNFGYFFFTQTQASDVITTDTDLYTYSELSALGLVFSVILFVVVTIFKKLVKKLGPSVE